ACPSCGHPIVAPKDTKSKGAANIGCSIALGLFLLVFFAGYLSNRAENNREAANPTCKSDWRRCSDNADLVNNYNGVISAQVACRIEADSRARYGTPEWPFLPFGTFTTGDQYVKTGKAIFIEQDANFQNGFGAMVRSRVTCSYDLNGKKVVDVIIANY